MTPDRRAGLGRFLKFALVGGLGFLADTGTLLALVRFAGIAPFVAKAASFGVAVLVTFEFNRRWAFGSAPRGPWLATFAAYLGVQGTGFLVNWVVFTLFIVLSPPFAGQTLVAAALASLVALAVNFVGAHRLVFGPNSRKTLKAN